MIQAETVKVVIRCRPLSKQEIQDNRQVIVHMDILRGEIKVVNPKPDAVEPEKIFTFDKIFNYKTEQKDLYQDTAFPIVESVLQGYNGTIFAYGQTGTGKTHTMEGIDNPPELKGVIPRTFEHIFQSISSSKKDAQFLVRASYLELYNEEIVDLLSKSLKKLEIREKPDSGVYIKDLTQFMIENPIQMQQKLELGRENKHVGETKMNRASSRSHSIFTITVEMSEVIDGQNRFRMGKLNLVDLAGSERQSKTGATGERFKEAININQSLTTLGNVISALVDQKSSHIPYRDSKLTRLLQDSLGGNTKTVMIANIGPADYNYDETLSTLRYANRAKNIKNKPKINEDPKDALLRQFQEEVEKLRAQLAECVGQDSGDQKGNIDKVIEVEKIVKVGDPKKIKELEDKIEKEKQEIIKKADYEKKKIEELKNLADNEKLKLIKQLEEKEQLEKNAKENQQKLLKKLKKMEHKLVKGSEQMEQALAQERELQKAKEELMEKERKQKQLEQEMKEKENLTLELHQKYNSQKEEASDKTKKIKQFWNKLKQLENENKEVDEFYAAEIEELQQRRREILKELKLRNLILEYFIPEQELQRLEMRALFNEEIDDWIYPNLQLAGNLVRIESQNMKKQGGSNDNDIDFLDIGQHPNVYFAYSEDGLVREEDLAPEERQTRQQNAKKPASAKKRPGSTRPTSSKKKSSEVQNQLNNQQNVDNFPKAKGLVKK